jgi:hypothetical protein
MITARAGELLDVISLVDLLEPVALDLFRCARDGVCCCSGGGDADGGHERTLGWDSSRGARV